MSEIRVAIVGVGNCAGSLVEGIQHYRTHPDATGLLFPRLAGFSVADVHIVCAFDIADNKVGRSVKEAIYAQPNNFIRLNIAAVDVSAHVYRGPTLDGLPGHLREFVRESGEQPVDVPDTLRRAKVDVVLNLLPTGSVDATEHYGFAALEVGAAFINCIPTVFAQRPDVHERFAQRHVPLFGDDIKSQVGSTIVHRTILNMLRRRGARVIRSSQVNIGGNTDFANFVHRAETKLLSKRKSLAAFLDDNVPSHIGHHYDPTQGPLKRALFILEAEVFGGSNVNITIQLQSDDKPNSAGSIIDLVRIAKYERDQGNGGVVSDGCAYYMKSQPASMSDDDAYEVIVRRWLHP